MRSSRSLLAAGALAVALVAAAPAAAQPAPPPGTTAPPPAGAPTAAAKEEARRLHIEGKALRERGSVAEALETFRRSHDLAPTPVTRLELARTLAALGRLIEAHRLADSVAELPVTPTETAKGRASREEAAAFASDLAARIPRVTLAVTPPTPDAEVTVDGAPVSKELLGGEQDLDPGEHVAVARAGERTVERRFTVAERERVTVELALPAPAPIPAPAPVVAPPIAAPPPTPAPPPEPAPPEDDGLSPVVPVSFTIAGVALATGLVTGGVAIAQAGELKDHCVARGDRTVCPEEKVDLLEAHQAFGTTSTIAFAVAGAAATLGVVVLAIDLGDDEAPAPARAPAASMRLRWAGTGLAAEGTWN